MKSVLVEANLKLNCGTSNPSSVGGSSGLGAEYVDKLLYSLSTYAAGASQVSLCNLPIEDKHVECVLARLRKLSVLDLTGCRKLSPRVASTLAAVISEPKAVLAQNRLFSVSLQRCFQLNKQSFCTLLEASAHSADFLCLALSHIEFFKPHQEPLHTVNPLELGGQASTVVSGLKMLVLNNCNKLTGEALRQIGRSCPNLQFLFLGGSTVEVETIVTLPDIAGLSLPPPVSQKLSKLSTGKSAKQVLGSVDLLLALLLQLPQLQAIELTFFQPAVITCLGICLAELQAQATLGAVPEVWDLNSSANVSSLAGALARCKSHTLRADVEYAVLANAQLAAIELASKCAVNCSSASRATPLHTFAEHNDVVNVKLVVALGAQLNAKDTSGATPLFLACEAGNTAVVELLLNAGADAVLMNAAGESPLYISALRGHLRVVKLLLKHFHSADINWHDPSLYCDCWTPLMAAAVANHFDVATLLLQTAGTLAAQLVNTVNRYGQNVVHIAARKGSVQLLRLLLHYAGKDVVRRADTSGDTPWDIARRNKHGLALAEFRRVCSHISCSVLG